MGHAQHHIPSLQEVTVPASSGWSKLYKVAGAIGVIGLAATFGLAATDSKQFFHSYLTAYLYWLALGLGCLFFVIIQHAVKAGWSVVIRRIAENFASSLPIFAVLFLPIVFGMHDLFHWTHEEAVASDPLLQGKSPYLNTSFFYVRAAIYLVLWSGMAWFFTRTSAEQDKTGDLEATRKMQKFSYASIAIFALSLTFAAFDWIMSLDPHWYSTMFGVYYFAGSVVSSYALLAIVTILLIRSGVLGHTATTEHTHDLGKLTFGFTVFWAYIAFSQYMLIWYANIPEETVWFEHRWQGSWQSVTYLLAIGHFAIPFFFLMPRTIKRNSLALTIGAVWILAMEFIDLYWLVMPNLHHHGVHFSIMDLTAWVGMGGVFFAAFGWRLVRLATVPLRDPRLAESLAFQNF